MTRRLNLLPWRQQQRQRRTRDFYRLLACACGAALMILAVAAAVLQARQQRMQDRALWLEQQTQVVRQQVQQLATLRAESAKLQLRTDVLNELQRQRLRPYLLLRELGALIPPNVVLQSLRQPESRNGAQTILLAGYADTGASVAALMDALREARSLSKPQLQEMRQPAGDPHSAGRANAAAATSAGASAGSKAGGVDFRIECTAGGTHGASPARAFSAPLGAASVSAGSPMTTAWRTAPAPLAPPSTAAPARAASFALTSASLPPRHATSL